MNYSTPFYGTWNYYVLPCNSKWVIINIRRHFPTSSPVAPDETLVCVEPGGGGGRRLPGGGSRRPHSLESSFSLARHSAFSSNQGSQRHGQGQEPFFFYSGMLSSSSLREKAA